MCGWWEQSESVITFCWSNTGAYVSGTKSATRVQNPAKIIMIQNIHLHPRKLVVTLGSHISTRAPAR